jgi:hypothetical protein
MLGAIADTLADFLGACFGEGRIAIIQDHKELLAP